MSRPKSVLPDLRCNIDMVRILLMFSGILLQAQALNNGLALTPPMGFNTWNYFGCDINETVIRQTTDKIIELGLHKAGYVYINIDDCWQFKSRNEEGLLVPHPERFPSGMKAIADYVHSKDLKFGMYSDAGYLTCGGFPGSLGHEQADAFLFAEWEIDYLKYDNCFSSRTAVRDRYTVMRDALNATGRPILYSLCSWGSGVPWSWGREVGNAWRIDGDITPSWIDILRCVDNSIGLSRFAGPNGWNDPDMLEVGNGDLSIKEQRSHFALWCLLKAPLLIGTDLRRLPAESLRLLLSPGPISVNQDPLGVAGDLVWKEGPAEVWAGPLAGGSRAVLLFNRLTTQQSLNITARWEMLGWAPDVKAEVLDLFTLKSFGIHSRGISFSVPQRDVMFLRLSPATSLRLNPAMLPLQQQDDGWRPWHTGPAAARATTLTLAGIAERAAKVEY